LGQAACDALTLTAAPGSAVTGHAEDEVMESLEIAEDIVNHLKVEYCPS
jgi:hypothetical protein